MSTGAGKASLAKVATSAQVAPEASVSKVHDCKPMLRIVSAPPPVLPVNHDVLWPISGKQLGIELCFIAIMGLRNCYLN